MEFNGGSNRREEIHETLGHVALVGIGILVNLKDIKRYIRISTM